MAQRTLGHDLVAVPPAISLAQHVALLDELGEDPVGGPLGDPDRGGAWFALADLAACF
jgi:hypothetical protein